MQRGIVGNWRRLFPMHRRIIHPFAGPSSEARTPHRRASAGNDSAPQSLECRRRAEVSVYTEQKQ
jgi:hypothetical protein